MSRHWITIVFAGLLSIDKYRLRKDNKLVVKTGFQILDDLKARDNQLHTTDNNLEAEYIAHWLDTVDGCPPRRIKQY